MQPPPSSTPFPYTTLFRSEGQAERLDELLSDEDRNPSPAALSIGVLDGGFTLPGLRVLTDHEIFRRERRSEEHTSELQSRRDLVCRLLLEKKKQGNVPRRT